MKIKFIIILFIQFAVQVTLFAQEYTVKGKVTDINGDPLYFASVVCKEGRNHVYTKEDGSYEIKLPRGSTIIIVSSLGYNKQERQIKLEKNLSSVNFILQESTLTLKEIVVSAQVVESKSGTSVYEIGEQAIKQVQAMNLKDVLSLLPGKQITPPNMNQAQQANLRTAASSSANNFGTSVIIDGAPVSNDANMQSTNPSSSVSGGLAGMGVDLRTITAASIENVEVISGVASPKYGNLTSGAILVKSKVGSSPLFVSANLTPTTYQFAANKGIRLKNNLGYLNTDVSYTLSNGSPIDRKNFYNNANLGLRWRTLLNDSREWYNTVSLQLGTAFNGQRRDPDEYFESDAKTRNYSYMLNVNGSAKILGKLSYTFIARADNQYSHYKSVQTNGPLPMTGAFETGTYFTTYSPLVYYQEKTIKGLPVNFNFRVETDQSFVKNNYRFSFNTGTQYVYDKNYGSGRVVAGGVSSVQGTPESRSAKFHEIPASKTFSLYHETDIKRVTDKSNYSLRLGGRYDYMYFRYNLFSPRLSFSAQYFEKLRFRLSWGVSYKAPAMIQLYPGPTYHDFTNLDFYANNPLERMAIVSTYVFQPDNTHLKPSRGDIKEIGVDWQTDKLQVRASFFQKELSDGIYHSPELIVLEKQLYDVIERPVDRQPIVAPSNEEPVKILRQLNIVKNDYTASTNGVELVVVPPKIELTNTQFNFTFSYMETQEDDKGFKLQLDNRIIGDMGARFGVYENPVRTTYVGRGNLTMIQHIPSLRLIFTLAAELNFVNYSDRAEASLYPYAYYDAQGVYNPIPESQRTNPEFESLKLPDHTYTILSKPPFYTNYHLQVRKETKDGHSFSFYANNCFWYNPEYFHNTSRRILNGTISFGFGVSFKLFN
ncbi:MAG: TonB-dependent receptor [Bacteroidales bacterium]